MSCKHVAQRERKERIVILVVYGVAYEEHKSDLLSELASSCNCIDNPYLVSGDFNMPRHRNEKTKNTPLSHDLDLFNSIVHTLSLKRFIFLVGPILGPISTLFIVSKR